VSGNNTMGTPLIQISDGINIAELNSTSLTFNGVSISSSGGSGSVDLSNYITSTALTTRLNDYASSSFVSAPPKAPYK
jgi:hypothetical protein